MSTTKTIAKNTLFLYIRMFLTMGVSLYTSRVVLNTLGVEDYGIFSVVGGIVLLFGFFNAAMSSATQRYLAFDIGKKDDQRLHKTFNATLIIHIGIALLILLLAETIGLWYVNNRLNVADVRMTAVNWVYQFSVMASLVGVMQVPFNALIIARERMNVFALLSIIDVILKLIIVYLLLIVTFDKLVLYSILVFSVTLAVALAYRFYCYKHFRESSFKLYKDKEYYKELLSYSGWNLFGNIAAVARGQGINLVLNVFFGTIVNAAYGITMQIQNSVRIFVNNFQLAVNPQIIKSYSQGNFAQTHKLIFQSCRFSFYLMLIIASPILLNTQYVLELWLKVPPPHTVIFVQLSLINILIDCVSGPLIIGAQATGKIKWYQIIMGLFIFLNLPVAYLLLKFTDKPEVVFHVSIIINLLALFFRLFFLRKMMNLNMSAFIKDVFFKTIYITVLLLGICYLISHISRSEKGLPDFLIQTSIVVVSTSIIVFFIGLEKNEKKNLINVLKAKIKR